ncbi:hypothetical protein [Elongatibacter sediminis]|uniref:Uncharacterized protein n=1 Tax=Elongatibacter sediminis TaxID=3119006 RepID=A0AAW9RDE7_9GAMM
MAHTGYLLLFEFTFLGVMLCLWLAKRGQQSLEENLEVQTVRLSKVAGDYRRIGDGQASRELRKLARELPIPWGWPNCRNYHGRGMATRSAGEAMHYFAECLFREKQLVAEAAPDPRVFNSVRALIEDRHHPVDKDEVPAAALERFDVAAIIEPDAARSPNGGFARHDVWMGLVGPVAESRKAAEKKLKLNTLEQYELKRPWGW